MKFSLPWIFRLQMFAATNEFIISFKFKRMLRNNWRVNIYISIMWAHAPLGKSRTAYMRCGLDQSNHCIKFIVILLWNICLNVDINMSVHIIIMTHYTKAYQAVVKNLSEEYWLIIPFILLISVLHIVIILHSGLYSIVTNSEI